jgi:hypothetical protein
MQDGAVKAYVYALFDDLGHGFGLANSDGTPRPEGVALANLMTLLNDPAANAATFTPGALDFNISATTGGDRMYLLQKSNGAYFIAVWNELRVRHGVTLTLAVPAAQIRVFNPVASTAAVQTIANASTVTLDMVGAPLLIAVTPAAPTQAATAQKAMAASADSADSAAPNAASTPKTIAVEGTGNTINTGDGAATVTALKGGNTITTGGGATTVYIGGTGNTLTFGAGPATVRDSGANTTYTFGPPGSGTVDTYGYILNSGAKLNLRTLLAGTAWQGDAATLGDFLKVETAGSNMVVSVNASGVASGATYPVAVLHDYPDMTLANLLGYAEY